MLSAVTSKARSLWARLANKEYRDGYIEAKIATDLALQIHALREERGWSQYELADKTGMLQPRISKLENSCAGVSVSTLRRLASAFDVGLSIKFVSFNAITRETVSEPLDVPIPSYVEDQQPFQTIGSYGIVNFSTSPKATKIPMQTANRRIVSTPPMSADTRTLEIEHV